LRETITRLEEDEKDFITIEGFRGVENIVDKKE
jgi:hypothetical protein